jgi:hypothetical protein
LMGEREGTRGVDPDKGWRKMFWSKAHRNTQRYTNK